MVRFNFSLRQMLFAVTIMSIAIGAFVSLARYSPESFVFAFIFSCSIGLFGLGVVILAAVMSFSVYASDDTVDRRLNIAKCANLALIGALMIALPLFTAIATFVLLPVIRTG